jgi:ribosomal protein S18 acetylase RimI-like enzyme
MLRITTLENSHKLQILSLGVKLFGEAEFKYIRDAVNTSIKGLSKIMLNDKNKVVGFALICNDEESRLFNHLSGLPDAYEIAYLGVHPDYHGQGIGSKLLKECIHAIFQQSTVNPATIWLLVEPHNNIAYKLYRKNGFRIMKAIDDGPLFKGFIMGLTQSAYNHSLQPPICEFIIPSHQSYMEAPYINRHPLQALAEAV